MLLPVSLMMSVEEVTYGRRHQFVLRGIVCAPLFCALPRSPGGTTISPDQTVDAMPETRDIITDHDDSESGAGLVERYFTGVLPTDASPRYLVIILRPAKRRWLRKKPEAGQYLTCFYK